VCASPQEIEGLPSEVRFLGRSVKLSPAWVAIMKRKQEIADRNLP